MARGEAGNSAGQKGAFHKGEEFSPHFSGKTLFEALRDAAMRYGNGEPILEDALGNTVTFKRLLIGARVLGEKLLSCARKGEAVGVLLPNANAVVICFLGLQSAARIPAMLNYTAGPATIVSACRTAAVKTVIASRAFVEKADLHKVIDALGEASIKVVWLEDVAAGINWFDKLKGLLLARKPLAVSGPDDPALILFTSGSEGAPKGVVLSHQNILTNCSQINQRVQFIEGEKFFNVLPVFHSFGLTGGTLLPLLFGVPVYLYPSPLHYKIIPKAAARVKPTVLFGTDTFLTGYARTAKDEDFSSVRLVVAGAEAVKSETKRIWMERFGAQVLEGFGMTEAAPVVAVNTPDFNRHGSVGQLLPGVQARLEPVDGINEGGRLWVSGPNVMLGYMKADRPGELQPIDGDGWHDSGDIVHIDEDGFVSICGRIKRFAKVAGEMVSLGAVELIVKGLWPEEEHAVVCVPDKRKGERLVLVTTKEDALPAPIKQRSREEGLTELMVPKDIVTVEGIPLLGSGKTDYVKTRKIALSELGLEDAA